MMTGNEDRVVQNDLGAPDYGTKTDQQERQRRTQNHWPVPNLAGWLNAG